MLILSYGDILKYFLIGLVVFSVLYSMVLNQLDMRTVIKITVIIVALVFILDNYVLNNMEGMETVNINEPLIEDKLTQGLDGCPNTLLSIPDQYLYNNQKEDFFKTGLEYDYNVPGYYLINNGKYSKKGINYDNVQEMICSSKLHDLLNQHNFNIIWSPHTHIGKARGYLNWDKMYE